MGRAASLKAQKRKMVFKVNPPERTVEFIENPSSPVSEHIFLICERYDKNKKTQHHGESLLIDTVYHGIIMPLAMANNGYLGWIVASSDDKAQEIMNIINPDNTRKLISATYTMEQIFNLLETANKALPAESQITAFLHSARIDDDGDMCTTFTMIRDVYDSYKMGVSGWYIDGGSVRLNNKDA